MGLIQQVIFRLSSAFRRVVEDGIHMIFAVEQGGTEIPQDRELNHSAEGVLGRF